VKSDENPKIDLNAKFGAHRSSLGTRPSSLIIGFGNPLRGDDGAGFRAAEELERDHVDARVLVRHQLTPELAEEIANAENVYFLDASIEGPPGTIAVRTVDSIFGRPRIAHDVTPEELLALAEDQFGGTPHAVLYTISGEDFDFKQELSPLVALAMPRLLAMLKGAIGASL
jgi:hydrogenase maturation protease